MLKRLRARAKRLGLAFELTEELLEGLMGEACPVLGLTYDFRLDGPLDLSPSLDRIDPREAYVPRNVAVISYRANRLKNNGTAEEHRHIGERMNGLAFPIGGTVESAQVPLAKAILGHARRRAAKRNVVFDLRLEDLPGIPAVCPYLGLPLRINIGRPADDSGSLDRIDNRGGYVPGNVEVVSLRANRLKGDGSAEEHLRIADWLERLVV
jgi:hypothetical protein